MFATTDLKLLRLVGVLRQAASSSVRLIAFLLLPNLTLAQTSPFQTGATALQANLLTLMTPVAVILVIGLGIMAMANRIAWGWVIGAIAGIAVAFGAPQIVTWIRGMFGV
jgi:type IV secretion system protein VirB2